MQLFWTAIRSLLWGIALTLLLWLAPVTSPAIPIPQSLVQVLAQTATPTDALARLFTSPELQAAWFTDSFLSQVSLAQIEQIVRGIETTLGEYQEVEAEGDQYRLRFTQGTVPTRIVLNEAGQISGLLFETPQLAGLDLAEAERLFADLPGEASLLVLKDDSERAAVNPDQPLAVGSAFKLLILQALQTQIAAGAHAWDEVVRLQPDYVSLPSGRLQTWPVGTPMTVQTLATLMIAESDNTATDHLLALVGREAVESLTERNRPFLSTREAFVLKDPQNQQLLARYRSGTEQERRRVLAATAALPLPPVDIFSGGPLALEVEWFMTTRELCEAIAAVADLPPMRVNPGLADPNQWEQIAFKGGSEPGVENLTTFLEEGNHRYCVSATWNSPDGIDELQLSVLYRGVIESLQD